LLAEEGALYVVVLVGLCTMEETPTHMQHEKDARMCTIDEAVKKNKKRKRSTADFSHEMQLRVECIRVVSVCNDGHQKDSVKTY
jgi:hypothetical protein